MRKQIFTATAVCMITSVGLVSAQAGATPFATRVISYEPAPGQFVNNPLFDDPARALGAPVGAGTGEASNADIVTLGGYGGRIVLGFDRPAYDHPRNPFGVDAIVFGNGFWVGGDPNRTWAECATVEISVDENGNGLADDAWYLIAGSHLSGVVASRDKTWDDDVGDATYPPANETWLTDEMVGVWQTSAHELPVDPFALSFVLENPNGASAAEEGVWGYVDRSPTLLLGDTDADNVIDVASMSAEAFYTLADDPMRVGIQAVLIDGAMQSGGGGDGFDIAWAINAATGQPAGIDRFDFVRITTAVDMVNVALGEMSAEIDAVSDARAVVSADWDASDAVDFFDLLAFLDDWFASQGGSLAADYNDDGRADFFDLLAFLDDWFAG